MRRRGSDNMAEVSRRKQLYMYHLGKCNECDPAAKRLCDKGLTPWNAGRAVRDIAQARSRRRSVRRRQPGR